MEQLLNVVIVVILADQAGWVFFTRSWLIICFDLTWDGLGYWSAPGDGIIVWTLVDWGFLLVLLTEDADGSEMRSNLKKLIGPYDS